MDSYFYKILTTKNIISNLLLPLSWEYAALMKLRRKYLCLRPYRAGFKVISVGNITMGGSGKTPVTIALAKAMQDKGYKVVVASRAYRAKWEKKGGQVSDGKKILASVEEGGDEALMVAERLVGIPVFVGKKRKKVLKEIEALKPDLVILDDALQHIAVKRDIDLVVFDSKLGLANGRVFPAGYLREPLSSLAENATLILHKKNLGKTEPGLESFLKNREYFRVESRAQTLDRKGRLIELNNLENKSLSLISAIADPGSFEKSVLALGLGFKRHHIFRDHYAFDAEDDIKAISKDGADYYICTQKDWGKLKRWGALKDKLIALQLETRLPEALLKKIESRLFP